MADETHDSEHAGATDECAFRECAGEAGEASENPHGGEITPGALAEDASRPCAARRSPQLPAESLPQLASKLPSPLWRHVLGAELRRRRHERGDTLGNIAARAGVSPQYLSEMERGVKDPSSEMIEAVAGALGVTLVDLTLAVAAELGGAQRRNARAADPRSTRAAVARIDSSYVSAHQTAPQAAFLLAA